MDDLISRKQAIDGKISIQCANGVEIYSDEAVPVEYLKALPSAQPEEAIPVSWIEARIERFEAMDNSLSGLTASIIRTMLNEWKREQKGDTT